MAEAATDFVNLSADVVAAYVSHNSVPLADLSALIATVHGALQNAAAGTREPEKVVLEPPVSIKKSITANHLISMEDGRPYKSLKRHLTAGASPRRSIARSGHCRSTIRWSRRTTPRLDPSWPRRWVSDRRERVRRGRRSGRHDNAFGVQEARLAKRLAARSSAHLSFDV